MATQLVRVASVVTVSWRPRAYCLLSFIHGLLTCECCSDLCFGDVDKTAELVNKAQRNVYIPLAQISAIQEVYSSGTEGFLVNEAKKWATKAAKDHKIITHGERVRVALLMSEHWTQKVKESNFYLNNGCWLYIPAPVSGCEAVRKSIETLVRRDGAQYEA